MSLKSQHGGGLTRREMLGLGIVSGSAFIGQEIGKEIKVRPQEVERVSAFLRGEAEEGAVLDFNGRSVNYKEFVEIVADLVGFEKNPKSVEALLDAFADMIEVEEQFGGRLNKLEILEDVEPMVSKASFGYVHTARSFGFGQIDAHTALLIAQNKASKLVKHNLLKEHQKTKLNSNMPAGEIVRVLNLQKDENLVYSFLEFYRGYNFYGKNNAGQLNTEHRADARTFALSVAAYSANFFSPMRAKGQTYFNELMLSNEQVRTGVMSRLSKENNASADGVYLDLDGDMGPKTLKAFVALSEELGIPEEEWPKEFKNPKTKMKTADRANDFNKWLRTVRQFWHKDWESFFHSQEEKYQKKEKDYAELARFITGRYHTSTKAFLILKEMDERKAREIFRGFVEERQFGEKGKSFYNLIASADFFEQQFTGHSHEKFIHEMLKSLPRLVTFDERYKGYVPMAYGQPRNFLANPKNVLERIIRAQDMDKTHSARIGLYPSRQERQNKTP